MTLFLEYGNTSPVAMMVVRLRRALRLNLKDMGKALGVSGVMISNYERGHKQPSPPVKIKMRNLAFYRQLPFAHEVFPEYDDPNHHDCPACTALRNLHMKQQGDDYRP